MALHKGQEGYVKIGLNTIAEIKEWSITETADTLDTSSMGDTARTYLASLTTATGSVTCHFDEADTTGQQAMTIGASVNLDLYVDVNTYAATSAIITEVGVSSSFDGLVERSFSFQVTGAVTWN